MLLIGSLLLAACGGGQPNETEEPVDQQAQIDAIYTQAAETLAAEMALTEAAKPQATSTPLSSPTPVFIATNTPVAEETPSPFPTLPSLPTPTQIPTRPPSTGGVPCLRAEMLFESPKDDKKLAPGESFIKYWNFSNSGSCDWNANFNLIFVGGTNMTDVLSFNLVDISNMTEDGIENGGKLEISVSMQAPAEPGRYKSIWMLRDDNGQIFGVGTLGNEIFWVEIVVRE